MNFSMAKDKYDNDFKNIKELNQSLVPVDGKIRYNIQIRGVDGKPNEE